MEKSRFIIKCLAFIFRWAFYLNIVLAGGAIGFQVINLISPKKNLTVPYLGKFTTEINNAGDVRINKSTTIHIPMVINKMSGYPMVMIPGKVHLLFTLLYTLFISGVILFANFHLKKLFGKLNESLSTGQPFHESIPKQMKIMSLGFIVFFGIGLILTLSKIIFIRALVTYPATYFPAFDNTVLNYLWISIFLYIMAEVFQAGLWLKQENDMTI
jgi:hypothetical protein